MSMQGYSGNSYDRFVEQRETSTLHKFKETFWTTKQAVIQKLGKKEDEHVVASDAELDAKLEVFKAIQRSCMELLRVIEKYQDRTCALSMEENATGRFLKANSGQDKTRAGKMMAAVGKSQSFSAQQRLALRVPLVRLYLEVETFRYRAISDTLMTVNRMEGARTEYRGALLWMKDVSEQLDPDTYKQLEKFRKVQAQVKKTKSRFDKLKLDVMQKIDLLAASRCNMFSHVLANYQSSLLHFWEKTSRTMTAVAESFKGYQYYEWNVIKELQEPARKLSQTSNKSSEHDIDDDFDPEKLITLEEEASEQKDNSSLQNLYSDKTEEGQQSETINTERTKSEMSALESCMDFGTDMSESLINLDLKNKCPPFEKRSFPSKLPKDLLSEELDIDNQDKDDMAILNEILNAPPAGDDDFSQEWQTVFGQGSLGTGLNLAQGDSEPMAKNTKGFMPSDLLDLNQQMTDPSMDASGGILSPVKTDASVTHQKGSHLIDDQSKPAGARPKQKKKGQKSDISAWFNLFADLDPLADPDAVGKKAENADDACMG